MIIGLILATMEHGEMPTEDAAPTVEAELDRMLLIYQQPHSLKGIDSFHYSRPSRSLDQFIRQQMFKSSATLIAVPQPLLAQWRDEFSVHCTEIPRILVISSNTEIPEASELATLYDVSEL